MMVFTTYRPINNAFPHLGRLPMPYNRDQETAAFSELRDAESADDHDAAERIANSIALRNMRMVFKIAHEMQGRGLDFDQLISAGMYGIASAMRKFDHRRPSGIDGRPIKFSSYCYRVILNQMKSDIRYDRIHRQPATPITQFSIDACEADVAAAILAVEDKSGDHEAGVHERQAVRAFLGIPTISARDKAIVAARFGIGRDRPETLESIGRRVGLTRERVRQIEKQSLEKMRMSSPGVAI